MIKINYKKRLDYKPELKYQDEYSSDLIAIKNSITPIPLPEEDGREEIEDLLENLDNLNNLITALPNEWSDIISDIYDQILDFVDKELTDQDLERVPEEDQWTYIPDKDEEDNIKNPEFDPDNMWDDDDFFPIQKEEHEKIEVAEKEYIKNLVDLFDDYFVNLHTIISQFWTNFMLSSTNKSTGEIKMILSNILLSSSNVTNDTKHLLDSAVRNQIVKDIKIDFFKTIFNAEETIKHLKQLKAIQELRLRYYNVKQVDGNSKSNQMNNNILIASQLSYDKKYDIAYENLYRYLKSSNEILNDTMFSWIQEIKSKQILIERKGIK